MEKKQYMKPLAEQMNFRLANLMITASPGVGGDFDPSMPIDAKGNILDDEDSIFDDYLDDGEDQLPTVPSLWK